MLFSAPMLFSIKSLSSNSPMKILIIILMTVWTISVLILETGETFWVPIFSIMLFNGGLMVLFLFIVSMIPKKKEEESSSLSFLFLFVIFFLSIGKGVILKMVENFYFQGMFLILISSIIMIFYFLGISKISTDSFKTLKSF